MEYSQMAKTERRKHLRNRTTRIRTWECSSQSAVPYRLAIVPKLRERDHLLPDYFREPLYSKLSRLRTVLCKT